VTLKEQTPSGDELDFACKTSLNPWQRLLNDVCRRAFSSPEAMLYEYSIAPALTKALRQAIETSLVGDRVLDVGAGGGSMALALRSGGRQVVGLDPSRAQVRRFVRRGPRSGVVQGRAEHLPFADNAFDSVYSSCAWKHWSDPAQGLAECLRVVRPGGCCVVVEVDGASNADEFAEFAAQSRVPRGMRAAYVRFALRTVVGVAPTVEEMRAVFEHVTGTKPAISRLGSLPFIVAQATRARPH
jgi:ubiquinone/menaquinone biosynthesis C-methylase UbiE